MLEETDLAQQYNSKNPFMRSYEWNRLKKAVKLAKLTGNETVLDFGCFTKALKKVLPEGCKYIGYDIVPEYSDVKDFSKLKNIDAVFALAVLEHLNEKELNALLKNFRKMGVEKLIVEVPRKDTKFSRLMNTMLGFDFHDAINHKIDWRTVVRTVDKYYDCNAYHNNIWITWISAWKKRH